MRTRRRGFMMMDVLAGIMLLVALASALATAATLRQRNAQHLADQRAALQIAQETLAIGRAPANSTGKVSITRTGDQLGDREWIEITVDLNGRRATLAGLAPSGGVQ